MLIQFCSLRSDDFMMFFLSVLNPVCLFQTMFEIVNLLNFSLPCQKYSSKSSSKTNRMLHDPVEILMTMQFLYLFAPKTFSRQIWKNVERGSY